MYKTALILTAVGSLNWGLVALFDFNLVSALFGVDTLLTNAVYILVAVAAVIAVTMGLMTDSSSTRSAVAQRQTA